MQVVILTLDSVAALAACVATALAASVASDVAFFADLGGGGGGGGGGGSVIAGAGRRIVLSFVHTLL